MGIHGLTKLIGDNAASAIVNNEIKNYFGRKVAVDASTSLYQFLVAVRLGDGQNLQNEAGETTSHLLGMFHRTIRMVENGIKPLYVFDGKPPNLKSGELAKRMEKRKEANKSLEEAKEAGDTGLVDKFTRRTVKVTREHNEECKRLLKLMGIPYMDAPCEAEAQCAALAKAGKVYAAASEDMDTLTFGSPVLLRHLTFSESRKMPIGEFHLDKVLEGLELSREEFVDLCILLGCDYCDSIKGIGPHRAITLIKQHRSIEKILENLDPKRHPVPEDWPFEGARRLFLEPEVADPTDLNFKWEAPDEAQLIAYLVGEKGFSEDRVKRGHEKLVKHLKTATQGRLDGFFKAAPTPATGAKRKANTKDDKKPATKPTKAAPGRRRK
ncbi:PIN domain-like protein [Dimargaris cristalligena]|uniref:Flap endonuclease 1 n=1 Tax=Dimargaris cristalligena TaxID=215637 RepID=A0A4P9ZQ47_9FUNG|nr:PIN domain-like protein [Dimargaris cristalligena]|eukprot:RKP34490.1 PIN domain-like protein [Dimargaris cristalligena]